MATKDELLAFAEQHGIAADASMLKADIEVAVASAGYDPNTLEEQMADEPAQQQEDAAQEVAETSSDAGFSTYRRVDTQREGMDPPYPGPQTQQERGKPTEGGGTVFSANRGG